MEVEVSLVSSPPSPKSFAVLLLPPFLGTEFEDTVTIAPGLVITKQSIGVTSTSTGISKVDGILG